jgi:hypothetical protein
MEQIVRFEIDSNVQPILFIVNLNYRFIDHNVIRAPTRFLL